MQTEQILSGTTYTHSTILTYDATNRLTSLVSASSTSSYRYDGLGNRYVQTNSTGEPGGNGVVTNYTLDTAGGLSQVVEDGANAYTYGVSRISQSNATGPLLGASHTGYFPARRTGSVPDAPAQP